MDYELPRTAFVCTRQKTPIQNLRPLTTRRVVFVLCSTNVCRGDNNFVFSSDLAELLLYVFLAHEYGISIERPGIGVVGALYLDPSLHHLHDIWFEGYKRKEGRKIWEDSRHSQIIRESVGVIRSGHGRGFIVYSTLYKECFSKGKEIRGQYFHVVEFFGAFVST